MALSSSQNLLANASAPYRKSGKEGFRVKKTPISQGPRNGRFESKNPLFLVEPCREMGIVRLKAPISGALGNGSLLTLKPSFPDFGDFDPCRGRTRSQELTFLWNSLAGSFGLPRGVAPSAPSLPTMGHTPPLTPLNQQRNHQEWKKLTRSSSKGVSTRALFAHKNGFFCKQFPPLRYRTFRSLEKGKFDLKSSLSETPFKPDRVSFCTPKKNWMYSQQRAF